MTDKAGQDFDDVFERLRALLQPYAAGLDCKADEPGRFYLDTHYIMKNTKPLFFGSVETRKSYVSYHLMPVYVNPALLDGMSNGLAKRMHGKSCFNFTTLADPLPAELAALTSAGFEDYRRQGYV
jgi:hypothetical protein